MAKRLDDELRFEAGHCTWRSLPIAGQGTLMQSEVFETTSLNPMLDD